MYMKHQPYIWKTYTHVTHVNTLSSVCMLWKQCRLTRGNIVSLAGTLLRSLAWPTLLNSNGKAELHKTKDNQSNKNALKSHTHTRGIRYTWYGGGERFKEYKKKAFAILFVCCVVFRWCRSIIILMARRLRNSLSSSSASSDDPEVNEWERLRYIL